MACRNFILPDFCKPCLFFLRNLLYLINLEHYLPLLEKKGRAIFYARPVQETLPAYFLDWLQRQELSPKELVALLSRCGEESCEDIMMEAPCHIAHDQIEDTVAVQAVDLHNYDAFLTGKAGAAV